MSPNLLLDGTSHYVKSQWAESLIFLWTSIEQLVNQIWNEKVINVEIDGIVEGRTKFLRDFRSWTTSTRIEVLFQKDFIPIEVYKFLNFARKIRNDFIHNGKSLNESKVRNALEGLFKLISLITSEFKSTNNFDDVLSKIYQNQRGELLPKKSKLEQNKVSHWLEIPQLPGDSHWGEEKYEVIEELVLKPLKKE